MRRALVLLGALRFFRVALAQPAARPAGVSITGYSCLPRSWYIGPAMLAVGIALGLGSALAHSVAYVFSRMFVTRRRRGVLRLMALAHVIQGVIATVLLPLLWSADVPPVSAFAWPLVGWAACYMTGQTVLFLALRRSDASRVSPLLAFKIVILAVITVTALGGSLTGLQWSGVLLAVLAAFVLNYTGGRLPRQTMLAIAAACLAYSLADLNIVFLVGALGRLGRLHASVLGVCMGNAICGVVGVLLWSRMRPGTARDLPYALPFALCWLAGVALIFGCFATVGAVFGNILQSTRGLFSILLGAAVAGAGLVHLERSTSRTVVIRRLAAAAMMTLAIAAYCLG